MPAPLVKSFSDKSGKSEKEVEELFKRAEEIVDDRYKDIKKDSDRYYALVVGILKNMLKIESFTDFFYDTIAEKKFGYNDGSKSNYFKYSPPKGMIRPKYIDDLSPSAQFEYFRAFNNYIVGLEEYAKGPYVDAYKRDVLKVADLIKKGKIKDAYVYVSKIKEKPEKYRGVHDLEKLKSNLENSIFKATGDMDPKDFGARFSTS